MLMSRRNRPLFMIDIAVPRDIDADVQHLNNVYHYNIDHLAALVRENVRLWEQELSRCHDIITKRAQKVMARFHWRSVEVEKGAASGRPLSHLFHSQPAAKAL
jgi:glutamyl-tRNA reductase